MSCFVMGPASARSFARHCTLLVGPWSRTPRCRRRMPLSRIMRARVSRRRLCARAREAADWTPAEMSWDVMFCHGAGLRPGRLRRSGGRSHGIAAFFPFLAPDAPLPEEYASPAHNACAFRGGAYAPACAGRRGRALRPTSPPVGVGGRLRSFMPSPSGQRAGRAVPVSRVIAGAPAPVRAGISRRRGSRA